MEKKLMRSAVVGDSGSARPLTLLRFAKRSLALPPAFAHDAKAFSRACASGAQAPAFTPQAGRGMGRKRGLGIGFGSRSGFGLAAVVSAVMALTACATASAADAGPTQIQPGEYITERGWGHLQVTQNAKGALAFVLQTYSGEDVCDLKGEIKKGKGIARSPNAKACSVAFKPGASALDVAAATPDACKNFCGYNGGFEGTYLKVAKGCGVDEIAQTRLTFKQQYQLKQYKAALATLSPVLDNCAATLAFDEEGDIRNDVAITQYHNGLKAQCLKTLEPYAEDARLDDDQVAVGDWPQAQADMYLDILKAARTNIGLCSKGKGKAKRK